MQGDTCGAFTGFGMQLPAFLKALLQIEREQPTLFITKRNK